MNTVRLVHGFNVPDNGTNTIDRLVPALKAKGYDVDSTGADYGWSGLLLTWLFNEARADKLVDLFRKGDILIGHSNGCAIIARAIDAGMPVQHVIFIHPALDNDWEPPKYSAVERIDVYYSENDEPTKWAARIPCVLWGRYGHCWSY